MAKDHIRTTPANKEFGTTPLASTWETIYEIDFKKDDFTTLKLWAEIKREGGSGDAEIRMHLTDGVDDYYSTGLTSSQTTWDPVGPDTLDISARTDKIWTLVIEGKAAAGATMWGRKLVVERTT